MNTRILEVLAGDHISTACKQACIIATTDQCQVEFDFNGIKLTASPGITPDILIQAFNTISEERHKAYIESPEYKAQQEKAERKAKERQAQCDAYLADAPPAMSSPDPVLWEQCKATNQYDPYPAAIIAYAERWARIMEARIKKGERLADIAEESSHIADTEGITGFMYGVAVSALSKHWSKGEALRLWHNLNVQRAKEGETANDIDGAVLNPAIMVVTPKTQD